MTVIGARLPASGAVKRARRSAKSLADCLCEEHRALARELVLLDEAADEVGTAELDTLRSDVDRAYDLVARKVLPHVKAEHDLRRRFQVRDCQPTEVDDADRETRQLVARLGALKSRLAAGDTERTPAEIRHVLYELHGLTRLHFADQAVRPRHAVGASHAS